MIVEKIVVFTREELRDNDGVELAMESLNKGHNLRTPGTEKLEERRPKNKNKKKVNIRIIPSEMAEAPPNKLLTLLKHCFEAYCSIYAYAYMRA